MVLLRSTSAPDEWTGCCGVDALHWRTDVHTGLVGMEWNVALQKTWPYPGSSHAKHTSPRHIGNQNERCEEWLYVLIMLQSCAKTGRPMKSTSIATQDSEDGPVQ